LSELNKGRETIVSEDAINIELLSQQDFEKSWITYMSARCQWAIERRLWGPMTLCERATRAESLLKSLHEIERAMAEISHI
jgi:hypothetical protein